MEVPILKEKILLNFTLQDKIKTVSYISMVHSIGLGLVQPMLDNLCFTWQRNDGQIKILQ
jgi:hypothetical protein